jgi:hypothetical protein
MKKKKRTKKLSAEFWARDAEHRRLLAEHVAAIERRLEAERSARSGREQA